MYLLCQFTIVFYDKAIAEFLSLLHFSDINENPFIKMKSLEFYHK